MMSVHPTAPKLSQPGGGELFCERKSDKMARACFENGSIEAPELFDTEPQKAEPAVFILWEVGVWLIRASATN